MVPCRSRRLTPGMTQTRPELHIPALLRTEQLRQALTLVTDRVHNTVANLC